MTSVEQNTRSTLGLAVGIAAMAAVITVSNILIGYPINEWVTWGHFSFPIVFFVTDLVNRRLGASHARIVAYAGFGVAVVLSFWLATPRIALASGSAFIIGQLTNIGIFDRLRHRDWWHAPLISSSIASTVDTIIFYTIAFAGTGSPWVTWSIGDYAVKLGSALFLILPYFVITKRLWSDNLVKPTPTA